MTLTRRPERRTMVWARVELADGRTVCFANLHASAGLPEQASGELLAAAANAVTWSGGDPLVFGGDTNVRPARNPEVFTELRDRFGLGDPTGPHAIDHILARGSRGRREAAAASAGAPRAARAGRPAAPALGPRAGHRDLRGEIVLVLGDESEHSSRD